MNVVGVTEQKTGRSHALFTFLKRALVLALIYLVANLVSGHFIIGFELSTWMPMSVCALLAFLWGYRYIPVYFVIYLATSISTGVHLPVAVELAAASSLACLLAVFLLKLLKVQPALNTLKDVLATQLIAIMAPLVAAGLGVLVLKTNGLIDVLEMGTTFLAWWGYDLVSFILFAPLAMVWYATLKLGQVHLFKRWDWLIVLVVLLITRWIFNQQVTILPNFGSLTYLVFPFMFWIALRLSQPGVTIANVGICLVALQTVLETRGPSLAGEKDSLLVLLLFFLVLTLTSLIIAALFSERAEADEQVKSFNLVLEEKVNKRTTELKKVNAVLKQELRAKHQIEKELRSSQERLRLIADNISDAIVLINTEGRIVDVNENVLDLFRVTRDKALHDFDLVEFSSPDASQRQLNAYFLRALKGEHVTFDWKARRPTDNTTFNAEINLRRIRLNDKLHVVISIRDLTERRKMEASEHKQRILAEALQNTAASLSNITNLNEVFDRILKNVGNVVQHDAVNLMLIENGIARIVHSHGYKKLGLTEYVRNIRYDVEKTHSLRSMKESGRPLIISDVREYDSWEATDPTSWIQSYAGAPIRVKGNTIGFLQLDSSTPGFYTQELASPLEAFASQAAVAIENARLYTELQNLAITDSLTGLHNRHGFLPAARREFELARRFDHQLAMIFFDIDHLKNINDTHGHPIGDKALQMIAECCRSTLRETDLVSRFGGDEFIALLNETDLAGCLEIATRLKGCINAAAFEVNGKKVATTVSMGIAEMTRQMRTLDELIDTADRGSYLAKSKGRDHIASVQSAEKPARRKKTPSR